MLSFSSLLVSLQTTRSSWIKLKTQQKVGVLLLILALLALPLTLITVQQSADNRQQASGPITPPIIDGSSPTPSPAIPITSPIGSANADFNMDGVVDLTDYSILIQNFGYETFSDARADINRDGIVDLTDYSYLITSLRDYFY